MNSGAEMTPQELSDTIGAIYDCVLEPELWPPMLRRLGGSFNSPLTFIVMHDVNTNQPARVFEDGGDVQWLMLYATKYGAINPIPTASWLRPVGEVYTLGSLFRDEEWYESAFYKEWMKPQSLGDMMGFMAVRSGKRAGWLGAIRKDSAPEFSKADENALQLLSPHICRAINISDALDLRTITSDSFEATVNALSTGVFLLDSQGSVVYSNQAAVRLVNTGNALRIVGNRLSPVDRSASAALAAALSSMINRPDANDVMSCSVALPGSDGEGWIATALPVDRNRRSSFVAPWAAKVAIFVQNSAAAPQLPGEAFAKLYNLTGSELRVVMAIAPGLGVTEAVDLLGLSEATVRTHLKSAFQKTGTSRQAELVRLLLASSPPIRQ
jgi:DNA-binding CsgD family transcriptional regulator/PAS domain-containing protein